MAANRAGAVSIFAVLVALEVAAVVLAVRATGCSFQGWLWNPRLVAKTAVDSVRSPLVFVLAYALADELAVEALHRWLFVGEHPVRAAIERHGWPARLAYHVEVAIVLAWPALLAGAAWSLFAGHTTGGRSSDATTVIKSGRSSDPQLHEKPRRNSLGDGQNPGVRLQGRSTQIREFLFGAWLVAVGGLAAVYPLPKGWTAPILHGVELLFVAAALAAIPAGWRSRAITTRDGRALGIVLVTELCVAVLGAWGAGSGVFSSWDELARVPYAIGWAVLCALLGSRRERGSGP